MTTKAVTAIKQILNGITPPYVNRGARKMLNALIVSRNNNELLFDGDDQIFKQLAVQAKVYFEYGCGKSTIWTSYNSNTKIFSVDTSRQWVQDTKSKSCPDSTPRLNWVDCGAIGDWGRPMGYSLRCKFKEYIMGPFEMTNESPELILIDGRFRVACFLTSLSRSRPGTHIIFDDYVERPYYHIVEEFGARPTLCGRQAIFTVPDALNRDLINQEVEKFSYVMD